MNKQDFIKLIAVTCEVAGHILSAEAVEMYYQDLKDFDFKQIAASCSIIRRKNIKPTIGNIINNIPDGRLGPEEAWALIPRNEEDTTIWTDEMAQAYGYAAPLLAEGDKIAARMAFKEAYEKIVNEAKMHGKPVKWIPSLGWNKRLRESALIEAAKNGQIEPQRVIAYLPEISDSGLASLNTLNQLQEVNQ